MKVKARANICCTFPSRISGEELTRKVILSPQNPKVYFLTRKIRLRGLTKKMSCGVKLYINYMSKVF